jgi:hypothetical protein
LLDCCQSLTYKPPIELATKILGYLDELLEARVRFACTTYNLDTSGDVYGSEGVWNAWQSFTGQPGDLSLHNRLRTLQLTGAMPDEEEDVQPLMDKLLPLCAVDE